MRDVAREAMVSIQTVSAVINDKPGITEETRTRIRSVIRRLGYRPFGVARSLRTRSTKIIALVVSDISNPFFATIASIAEDFAHAAGYNLILFNTHADRERERHTFQTIVDRWVDGLLFVATVDQVNGLDLIQQHGLPIVVLDRIPAGFEGPSVVLDNGRAGRLAAEHLLDLGHRRLAHISGPLDLRLSRERQQGFHDAILARGLTPGPTAAGDTQWSSASGYRAMRSLLAAAERPTAVFAANDRMAIGAMRAIAEAGLSIPGDLSIVGVDDIEVAAYQRPALTTVAQSLPELAARGIRTLIDLLTGREPEHHGRIVLDPTLVIRESTQEAPQ